MFTAVVSIRCVALLTFAIPMLIRRSVRLPSGNPSREGLRGHLPSAVNIAACGLLVALLIVGSGRAQGVIAQSSRAS